MNTKETRKAVYERWPLIVRKATLFMYDIIVIQIASFCALWLQYEFLLSAIPANFLQGAISYAPVNTSVTILLFIGFKLYRSLWSFASLPEFINIGVVCLLSGLQMFLGTSLLGLILPRSYSVLYTGFLAVGIFSARFLFRILRHRKQRLSAGESHRNILLIGGGDAGNILLREIMGSKYMNGKVVGIIDDDPAKRGGDLHGARIVGGREAIEETVRSKAVDEIIIAMPSVSRKEIRKIVELCGKTHCPIKILPGFCHFMNGKVSTAMLRNVEIEDLLGREPIEVNLGEIMGYVCDKTVLVTGGGGSIGSELCRQLASYSPKHLLLLDIYENTAYDLQQELLRQYPELPLTVLIASVRDRNRMNQIFETYRPDIVYHAAAHKHVPLMEESPAEAIKNNVFGTLNVIKAAGEYNAEKFVLISTDKAVNPVSILGASKRICEMTVQALNSAYHTKFSAVRFGNVLGSNGSVIPLFKKQIELGGPVTVTHKDIARYFMTIPEAVSLVLQAGAYAKGGEIFVLDMGDPVKIDDLARNLIRMSGFIPDVDINVIYIGLRPGEKLSEELFMPEESLRRTDNRMIFVDGHVEFNAEKFWRDLNELKHVAEHNSYAIRHKVCEIVGTYTPDQEENNDPRILRFEDVKALSCDRKEVEA